MARQSADASARSLADMSIASTTQTQPSVFSEDELRARRWKPTTIAQFLDGDKIPLEVIRKTHKKTHYLVTRVLGTEPISACYAEINPTTLAIRDTLVPTLLNIPITDFGMGIDPALRASLMYCFSRSFGCMYCSSHSAGFGTINRGAGGYLDVVSRSFDPKLRKGYFSEGDEIALEFAKALGPLPTQITLEQRLDLARHFSEAEEEIIVLVCACMGWLTRFMDSIGVPIEYVALRNAENFLQPELREEDEFRQNQTRWSPGKHCTPQDSERLDSEYLEFLNQKGKEPDSVAKAMFTMVRAVVDDEKQKFGVPMLRSRTEGFMLKQLGFCPYWSVRIKNVLPRRSVVFAVLQGVCYEENNQVPVALKYVIIFLQACRANNQILRAHFGFLAFEAGMPLSLLSKVHRGDLTDDEVFSPSEWVALRFAEGASMAPAIVPTSLCELLCSSFRPSSVVDIVGVLCVGSMLQVITAAYPPQAYEPEIADFVAMANSRSDLAFHDADEEWPDWDGACSDLRNAMKKDAQHSRRRSAKNANMGESGEICSNMTATPPGSGGL